MEMKSLKIPKQNGHYKVVNNFATNVQEGSTPFTLYELHVLLGQAAI